MPEYKALFLDIDGTIITPDDQIEESTKQAVVQAQEKGIHVFLATGRPLHEISPIADELHVTSMIGYNGAYAVSGDEDLFKMPMDRTLVENFTKIAKQHGHEAILFTSRHNYLTTFDSPALNQFLKKLHFHKNKLYTSEVTGKILGITLVNVHGGEDSLYETYPGLHLSQVNVDGLRHSYDVIRDTVNKGIAVSKILKKLGIPKEEAIAFGDGINDKEMLKAVGESFAMGNSNPKLFSFAKHRTTKVTESGIYNGLKTLGIVE
ncbi:Cof-type HAD-IIB family hydrolase [Heyndrickxia acidiproducens]|uniref:Cof-type HAD-IIB family hydrolase n=1 Tax=Heyndrickxia acidiproducens TaxID=1121084 RepID=UPI00035D231A|nr:Cof-type HAD-IIB family hydrolase [Heyndrickxia acidiproducens]